MQAHEVVAIVWLIIAIVLFLAALILPFFLKKGGYKKPFWLRNPKNETVRSKYVSTPAPKRPAAKKHSGKCTGDCANCPPHYGYRHGRWYYGHGHIEGCEFGGNKGDGA